MKLHRLRPVLTAFACLLLLSASVAQTSAPASGESGGEPTAASAPTEPMERPFWHDLAAELKLDQDRQQALARAVQAKRDALAEFDRIDGQTLAQAIAFCEKNKKDKSKRSELKATLAKISELQEARRKIQFRQQEQILGVLNAQQKVQYESYRLYVILRQYFAQAQPTETQKASLRRLAQAAGQKAAAIDLRKTQDRQELLRKLIHDARGEVPWTPRQVYEIDEGGKTSHVRLPTIEEEENP